MKKLLALAAILFATQVSAADFPWLKDKTVLDATIADVQPGGILAVKPHAAALEQALFHAKPAFAMADADPATLYVLIDGPTDTPTALLAASVGPTKKKPVAVFNPYPGIAFFLSTYYDASGRPADALRVLDAALALPYPDRSEHRTDLLVERGSALAQLKRWKDAIASYDAALAIPGAAPAIQAYVYRGKAAALTGLGRGGEAKGWGRKADDLLKTDKRAQADYAAILSLKSPRRP
jgi:tetratricopeptide (TPR) repeat protein